IEVQVKRAVLGKILPDIGGAFFAHQRRHAERFSDFTLAPSDQHLGREKYARHGFGYGRSRTGLGRGRKRRDARGGGGSRFTSRRFPRGQRHLLRRRASRDAERKQRGKKCGNFHVTITWRL